MATPDTNIYDAPTAAHRVSAQLGREIATLIKLDANENPYGTPPLAIEALSHVAINRYPDADGTALRQALAGYTGCDLRSIVLGNGSDELIDLTCRNVLHQGDEVIISPPTFSVYALASRAAGGEIIEVGRNDRFALDIRRLCAAVNSNTRIIFLCTPNNPTGETVDEAELRLALALGPLVVLDEAYAEFAGTSYMPLTREYPNLIILRTFSKAFGLAGLRIGYGIFPEDISSRIMSSKLPYNVNAVAQAAALGTLQDLPWVEHHLALIRDERERLWEELRQIEGLEPMPSKANFLLVHATARPASEIHASLLTRGIMVRHFSQSPLADYLRITVGTPEQNMALLKALREIVNGEHL